MEEVKQEQLPEQLDELDTAKIQLIIEKSSRLSLQIQALQRELEESAKKKEELTVQFVKKYQLKQDDNVDIATGKITRR